MISDSLEYDPLDDLTKIFSQEESLSQLDDLITATENYKNQLEEKIRDRTINDRITIENEKTSSCENFDFEILFEKIKQTKKLSQSTEATIAELTRDISHLDNAKKNITKSMTWFENLKMLSDSYVSCKKYLESENFVAMCGRFKVMHSLSNSFQEYKSLDEFCKFLNQINRLENDTMLACERVCKEVLRDGASSKYDAETMRNGVCCLADTNRQFKEKIMRICLDSLLYEIKEIFQVDDEAGSLENLSRRYIFFKRVLNNFQATFAEYFPAAWEIPLKITDTFFSMTSKDLKILLKRDLNGQSSIDLFMQALQSTLEFEKYISVKFSHKFEGKISTCFEPYLKLWVTYQDSTMSAKMLTYLNEKKIPETTESLVVPSSADLFRTYRSIFSQTLSLVEGRNKSTLMLELAKFFVKWLTEYMNKILQPLLLPENAKIDDKTEAITYTVLLVNTADYCSVTIEQLQEKLSEYLDKDNDNTTTIESTFENVKRKYTTLVSNGINLLLYRILDKDLEFAWREFSNTNWSNAMVEDYSRYATTLQNMLDANVPEKSTLKTIVTQFNRDVYAWNFLDKTIDLVTNSLELQIIKLLKPSLPYATLNSKRQFEMKQVVNIAEQLLLDLELIKKVLHSLPDNLPQQDNSSKRIVKHADKNTDRLSMLLKLLVAPLDSETTYMEIYSAITHNKDTDPS